MQQYNKFNKVIQFNKVINSNISDFHRLLLYLLDKTDLSKKSCCFVKS